MVMDKKDPRLTEFDWQILGHEYLKNGRPGLPRCRLNVPLPSTPDGLHTIAHRLSGLAEELHVAARHAKMGLSPRQSISDARGLLHLTREQFNVLHQEWERELQVEEEATAETEEQLRVVT